MSSKSTKLKTNVQGALKPVKNGTAQLSIDEIDRKILRFLMWDARLSYREIARQSKLSTTTVIERLKKLKSAGVIKGYSANLDSSKLGYALTAIIELVAPKINLPKAINEIADLPNVYATYQTTGDVDAIIIAKFKDVNGLQDFLKNLYAKLAVQRSETRIVLDTVKEDFRVII